MHAGMGGVWGSATTMGTGAGGGRTDGAAAAAGSGVGGARLAMAAAGQQQQQGRIGGEGASQEVVLHAQ